LGRNKAVLIGGAAAVVIAVAGFAIYWLSTALNRRFDAAVAAGRLWSNSGDGAFDYYQQAVRQKGGTSGTVLRMRRRVYPILQARVNEQFDRWYRESDLGQARWSDLAKLVDWLVELGPEQRETQARQKFAQGQVAMLAGRFEEAHSLYQTALNLRPGWPLALNGIGRACRNLKNLTCAEEYYRKAAQADPQWIFPHQNLAGTFMEQNRLAEAEAEYLVAVRMNPNRAGSRFLLGQLYDRARKKPEACAEYRAALSLAAGLERPVFDRELVNRRIQRLCQ
jgi:tetratricopeptide (TPR) repeat protein